MFHLRRVGGLMILESDLLPVKVKHAFATRRLASKTNSQSPADTPDFRIDSLAQTSRWWVMLRDSLFSPQHLCLVHNQVHGGTVRVVDPDEQLGEENDVGGFRFVVLGDGDAILKPFGRRPVFLAITTADCLPCLAYDPVSGAVGVVHAGWRGLATDIPANALREFKSRLGANPSDLIWAIGPSIDMANYEVGTEVIAALETAGYAESDWLHRADSQPGWTRSRRRDHYMLNLAALIRLRLSALGVPHRQIDTCSLSTFGNPNLFFSYRRDGDVRGLQAAVIG
jgi:YfiH family protein